MADRAGQLAPAMYLRDRGELTVDRPEDNAPIPVLTIEPGVVVESVADTQITVGYNRAGTLVAKGTADKPIKFTSFDKKKGSWKGFQFYDKATDIEFASSDDTTGAVRVNDDASADIEDVIFAHLDGVGLSGNGKKLTAKNLKADDAKGAQAKPQ